MWLKKGIKSVAFDALRVRDFRMFLLARLFAMLGFHVMGTCVGWQIYSLTSDPLSLGFIGLAEAIPYILTALFGGYIADHYNRKMITMTAIGVYLLCTLFLLGLSADGVLLKQWGTFPIYSIIFLSGIARGFLGPAMFALMSQILPRELYANGATWNSTVWQVAAVAGPALGGLIYGFAGVEIAYLIDACLVLLGILLFIPVRYRAMIMPEKKEGVFTSIHQGLRYVFNHQIIVGALTLDMFAVLFGGAVALLPMFCSEILNSGPEGLGILRSAPALGAVAMAMFIAFHPPKANAGKWLLISVAGFGVATICFALSEQFWWSFLFLALGGAFDNTSVVIRSTILQLMTPDTMRGRVTSVNSIFIGSSNEIGAFESGVTAKWMGLIPAVVFGGCMTLGVVGITWKFAPKLRAMKL